METSRRAGKLAGISLLALVLGVGVLAQTTEKQESIPGIVPLPPNFQAQTPQAPGALPPGPLISAPRIPAAFKPIPAPTNTIVTHSIGTPFGVPMPTNVFAWESDFKEYTTRPDEDVAPFSFNFTNVTSTNVVVNFVRTSCGCTVPKMPNLPWTIGPGAAAHIEFSLDFRGKSGSLTKVATLETSAGAKTLGLRVNITPKPAVAGGVAQAGGNEMGNRVKNLQVAAADRQAVFRNDCAKCHAEPTVGKKGQELYGAACGICHESDHRASMVPDLKALKHPTDRAYWLQWITLGKPYSLMPAFSKKEGGPLTDEQVESLADYLSATIKPLAGSATNVAAAARPLPTASSPRPAAPAPAAVR
jgi:mono/diheme cytochrome c family protein